jgi:hypothetical protein
MTKPSEFERAAWKNKTCADQFKPETALRIALDEIEKGDRKFKHVMILAIEELEDSQTAMPIWQAGKAIYYEQLGMLSRANKILQD